jgi:hypothetical protein
MSRVCGPDARDPLGGSSQFKYYPPYLLALSNPKNRWGGGVPPPAPPPGAPLRGADETGTTTSSRGGGGGSRFEPRRASRAMQCCTRLWHVRSAPSMLEHVMPTPWPSTVPLSTSAFRGASGRSLAEGAPPAPPCAMQHAQPAGCCSSCTLA